MAEVPYPAFSATNEMNSSNVHHTHMNVLTIAGAAATLDCRVAHKHGIELIHT